jgi:hypothetical protein
MYRHAHAQLPCLDRREQLDGGGGRVATRGLERCQDLLADGIADSRVHSGAQIDNRGTQVGLRL